MTVETERPFMFAGLEPDAKQQTPAKNVTAAIDAVAERLGFGSREPVATMPIKRRKPVDEPTFSFTARVSLKSGNAFIAYCERERLTYREGFDRLVAKIDP